MTEHSPPRHASVLTQLLWIYRHRRAQLWSLARDKLLFYQASFSRRVFGASPGIQLSTNVRLQRNRCLFAEAPHASISIGENSIIFERAKLEAFDSGKVSVGENSVLGDTRISCRYEIRIGSHFLSSWNVLIQDFDPHPINPGDRLLQIEEIVQSFRPRLGEATSQRPAHSSWAFPGCPIVIGNNVWLGANVVVLKGARIGSGCVVAAGSVVTAGEYAENSLIAGNPAQCIKAI